jgi:hypothetical protein
MVQCTFNDNFDCNIRSCQLSQVLGGVEDLNPGSIVSVDPDADL